MIIAMIIIYALLYLQVGVFSTYVASYFIKDITKYEAQWWFWLWWLMLAMVLIEGIVFATIHTGKFIVSLPYRIHRYVTNRNSHLG